MMSGDTLSPVEAALAHLARVEEERRAMPRRYREAMREAIRAGATCEQIGPVLGILPVSVRMACSRLGIPRPTLRSRPAQDQVA